MKKTPKKTALTQTTEEYASRSSIHGIGYVFDNELNLVDRLLWLIVVLVFLGIATALTFNFWTQWENEQVPDQMSINAKAKSRTKFTLFKS